MEKGKEGGMQCVGRLKKEESAMQVLEREGPME